MTTTTTKSNKQKGKSAKRRQQLSSSMDIGSPRTPVRKRQEKNSHEVLSDWVHAS